MRQSVNKHAKTLTALAVTSLLLTACGGGDDDRTDASAQRAGDTLTTTMMVDDKLVMERDDVLYAVSAKGELVSTEDAGTVPGTLIPITQSLKVYDSNLVSASAAQQIDPASAKAFYTELWNALKQRHGLAATASMLVDAIDDFDQMVPEIYAAYQHSGMSMASFVDFYETLDDVPFFAAQEEAERQVSTFVEAAGTNEAGLLAALQANGLSWRAFLDTMAGRQHTFNDLRVAHGSAQAGTSMAAFVAGYVGGAATKAGDGTNQYDLAIHASKMLWDIIKDGAPQTEVGGAKTSVLAAADKNPLNYGNAQRGQSVSVRFQRGDKWWHTHQFIAKFNVVAYHSARHPSFGGAWLPTVYFNVEEASAKGVGAKLNVDAEISTLANAGPANAPVPQFDVVTTIRTKGAAIKNMYETSTFIVSGNKAPTLAKAVN